MKSCYHKPCDNYNEARKNERRYNDSLAFLTKTTQALVLTIIELTTEKLNNENSPIEKVHNATLDNSTASGNENKGDTPRKFQGEKGKWIFFENV